MPAALKPNPERGRGGAKSAATQEKRPLESLVVEDMPQDVDLLVAELMQAGVKVIACRTDTPEAFAARLAAQAWDAVISDFHVPGFGAFEALEIVKTSGFDGPFIVVSSKIGEAAAVALMKAGAHDYVMKGDMARLAPALEREIHEAAVRRDYRQSEIALKTREQLLRNVAATMGEGLLVCDLSGGLIFMNPAAERLLGFSAISAAGKPVHEWLVPSPADDGKDAQASPMVDAVRRGDSFQSDVDLWQRRDGLRFPVTFAISPLKDGEAVYGSVTVFRDITLRKNAEARMRELTLAVQQARENEQARIARELHDELGQILTAIKLDVSLIGARLLGKPEDARLKINAVCKNIDGAMDAVRRLAADLRPVMLEDLGLCAAIDWQLKKLRETTGVDIEFRAELDDNNLDNAIAFTAYRVVQESLTNIARHANARRVFVSVTRAGEMLKLEISDDGVGMKATGSAEATPVTTKLGIVGLRERVEATGGQFSMISAGGSGTTVQALIPCNTSAATGRLA